MEAHSDWILIGVIALVVGLVLGLRPKAESKEKEKKTEEAKKEEPKEEATKEEPLTKETEAPIEGVKTA